jgi:hypothetical protein
MIANLIIKTIHIANCCRLSVTDRIRIPTSNIIFGMMIVFRRIKHIFVIAKTISYMKKIGVIFLVAFVAVLVLSSCNKKECPAYSKANTEEKGVNS